MDNSCDYYVQEMDLETDTCTEKWNVFQNPAENPKQKFNLNSLDELKNRLDPVEERNSELEGRAEGNLRTAAE